MSLTLSILERNIYKTLGDFFTGIALSNTTVVVGQINRVAPPSAQDYIIMNAVGQERLSTNVDSDADALFTGSISGNVLTISAVQFGAINVDSPVFGVGVAAGTVVTALGTGTGGVGTYTVNNSQTVASEPIAAGIKQMLMPAKMNVQVDVHGPNSADNATIIAAAFRDSYAAEQFSTENFDIAPLYVSDPRQIPYVTDSQQIEQRWVIDAFLQINPVIAIPQQYAGALVVTPDSVDATFPP